MTTDAPYDPAAIEALVAGLDPIDWQQLELLARLPFAKRILTGMQAREFAMAALRGTFRRRFPELSQSELNMKVLAYLTPVRMGPLPADDEQPPTVNDSAEMEQ
jgi:hypothetical protein